MTNVTGGAGRLGSATVARIVGLGELVYAVDSDESAIAHVAETLLAGPGIVIPVAADVESVDDNRALIRRVGLEHGQLDRLINNVGIQQRAKFGKLELEHSEWMRVLDVNLLGGRIALSGSGCHLAGASRRECRQHVLANVGGGRTTCLRRIQGWNHPDSPRSWLSNPGHTT